MGTAAQRFLGSVRGELTPCVCLRAGGVAQLAARNREGKRAEDLAREAANLEALAVIDEFNQAGTASASSSWYDTAAYGPGRGRAH